MKGNPFVLAFFMENWELFLRSTFYWQLEKRMVSFLSATIMTDKKFLKGIGK